MQNTISEQKYRRYLFTISGSPVNIQYLFKKSFFSVTLSKDMLVNIVSFQLTKETFCGLIYQCYEYVVFYYTNSNYNNRLMDHFQSRTSHLKYQRRCKVPKRFLKSTEKSTLIKNIVYKVFVYTPYCCF